MSNQDQDIDTIQRGYKGFKYRIYPTKEQKVLLERTFGSARHVYNHFLDYCTATYETYKLQCHKTGELPDKPSVSYKFLSACLTIYKQQPDRLWLNDVSSVALQQEVKKLARAFSNFFSKKGKHGYPVYKSKRDPQSITLVGDAFYIQDGKLILPKSKQPVKIVWSRPLPSEPTSVTISRTKTGKYYASFICQVPPALTNGQGIIGIDLGIKIRATISNGVTIENPRHYVTAQRRLRRLQQQHSRKKKGSANREKARIRLAKHHEHIANQRLDFTHKVTTKLVCDNQAICIEDLNVAGMSRNHHLAKHILDAGFGLFRRLLSYKVLNSYWCRLIIADRYYPSTQQCNACGRKPIPKIKLGVYSWTCPYCKTVHARDDNASLNLRDLAVRARHLWEDRPGQILLMKDYKHECP